MSLATMPLWISGTLLVVVPTVLAMAGPIIARRVVGLEVIEDLGRAR